ncbi:MAG TPA: Rpn family recombination-promoting nuclease/putative transposase [Thermotogota bacterium]|nr:Rpn family recombination-promoting nuclease/putative transposase [Saccharofermentans sp.]HPR97439.1 Rpn family recombination-promoting nuclease/putative transposase [Thermotogota bacterium]
MGKERRDLMDPKIDFVFKLLFGNEKDTSFLISFLNASLALSGEKTIKSVLIKSPVNDRQTEEDKLSIMDVKAETNDETIINIEIQLRDQRNMRERTLYHLSTMIAERLNKGEDYRKLSKTVTINILDFNLLGEKIRFHNKFRFLETETHKELTDAGEIHFMELPVLRRYIEQNKESITDLVGKEKLLDWLLFIDDPDSEYARLAESSDEVIGRAKDMLRTLSADEKLREEYLAREKAIMDHYASLKAAESEGIEQGIERGKLQMVAQMLKDGMSIDLACKYSGLSEEIIRKAIQE